MKHWFQNPIVVKTLAAVIIILGLGIALGII